MTDGDGTAPAKPYRGLLGAFRYAPRASESRAFRAYALLATLAVIGLTLVFGGALVVWIAASVGLSPLVTLSRAFLVVVWLFVVAPVIAPVLLVARRHRHGAGEVAYDARMGGAGVLYLLSLYLGLIATVPADAQEPVAGGFAPLVEALYAAPQAAGALPPLAAVALMVLVHRYSR